MNKLILVFLILIAIIGLFFLVIFSNKNNFQTKIKEETKQEIDFSKNVQLENNKIIVYSPKFNEKIKSPLKIFGKAKGVWFFEASFPVILTDWDGKIIAETWAQAKDDWMTENFVPFEAILEFKSPVFDKAPEDHFSRKGYLILKKDNPSGLLEYDDSIEIPIVFDF